MEAVETTYPLERIVDEIVRVEFQCEILSAKSIRKTERKLEHYETLRKEMLLRHQWEVNNMDTIIQSYKKPLELHGKTMARKQEKLAELRGKLAERDKAISSLNALPPPAIWKQSRVPRNPSRRQARTAQRYESGEREIQVRPRKSILQSKPPSKAGCAS